MTDIFEGQYPLEQCVALRFRAEFPLAFVTTQSGGGDYKLVLSFGTATEMYRAHDFILGMVKSQAGKAHDRRIVACLNACAGLDVEALEAGGVGCVAITKADK